MTVDVSPKDVLRKEMLLKLRGLDKEENKRRNVSLKEKIFSDLKFRSANFIMSYVSKSYEVDTWEIIKKSLEMGKKVAVPFVLKNENQILPSLLLDPSELVAGPYGIYQPHPDNLRVVNLNQIEIIIVPGVAFDKLGNRLGHGCGYFDRFLKRIPQNVPTVGLAYSCQIVENLPLSQTDIPVSSLIYE